MSIPWIDALLKPIELWFFGIRAAAPSPPLGPLPVLFESEPAITLFYSLLGVSYCLSTCEANCVGLVLYY